MFQLKPLSPDAVTSALAKAERYRLLNEPRQAESICLDVLALDATQQQALTTLVLSLTDQFGGHPASVPARAREVLPLLDRPYDRAYYAGLICERLAIAQLARGAHGAVQAAGEWLKDALGHYAEAERLRAPGNDDAILRWNACVRLLHAQPDGDDDTRSTPIMLE
jgi:hypothetical protein